MREKTLSKKALRRIAAQFTAAFNENDLDRVMSYFAEDAVYDQFNDESVRGIAAIRQAFEPQFRGAYGRMQFLEEEVFVDDETRKVLLSWTCARRVKQQSFAWRGLDILHFDGEGRITSKATYAKAKIPLLQRQPKAS